MRILLTCSFHETLIPQVCRNMWHIACIWRCLTLHPIATSTHLLQSTNVRPNERDRGAKAYYATTRAISLHTQGNNLFAMLRIGERYVQECKPATLIFHRKTECSDEARSTGVSLSSFWGALGIYTFGKPLESIAYKSPRPKHWRDLSSLLTTTSLCMRLRTLYHT